jgi:hypothetical protein
MPAANRGIVGYVEVVYRSYEAGIELRGEDTYPEIISASTSL